ncbi:MAG: hypothetical protein JOY73_05365 [Actinobacteria bacterium]|nr:hypothetical protein [Actinomycetota bacterium]
MRGLRYAVALVVVVDFLVAVVQMQQAIIERASFTKPSVTTFGQYAVMMSSKTSDDLDLYVRDPQGDVAWYGSLQAGALSLEHDQIPGSTDPVADGVHETTIVRESAAGQYVANVDVYNGSHPAAVTVQLWDLRGANKRMVLARTFGLRYQGQQVTAFRWRLDAKGDLVGHDEVPTSLLRDLRTSPSN